jgi:hypothetical protein
MTQIDFELYLATLKDGLACKTALEQLLKFLNHDKVLEAAAKETGCLIAISETHYWIKYAEDALSKVTHL